MRPIARQSARLANSSHVRVPSCSSRLPQHHHPHAHTRSFSRCAQHRLDNRSSNDPPAPSSSYNYLEDQQRSREAGGSTASKEGQSNETRAADEDRKQSKTGKTFRQRKKEANTPAVLKPPPIPDWFLQHNVKLHLESVQPNQGAKSAQVLQCVDKETGHTLFTLPYYEAWPVPGSRPSTTEQQVADEEPATKALANSFFDNKFEKAPRKAPTVKACSSSSTAVLPSDEAYKDANPHALLRWAVLQAETGIRAAFAVARVAPRSASHAASRVDLSLYCKDPDSHEQLDDFVEDLAAITESNLIRLDANDFADLTAEYVGQGSDVPGSFSQLAFDVFNGFESTPRRGPRLVEEEEEDEMDEDEQDEDGMDESQSSSGWRSGFTNLDELKRRLVDPRNGLARALRGIGSTDFIVDVAPQASRRGSPFVQASNSDARDYDEAKLSVLLDSLFDAPEAKRAEGKASAQSSLRRFKMHLYEDKVKKEQSAADSSNQAIWRVWRSSPGCWLPDVAGLLAVHISRVHGNAPQSKIPVQLEAFGDQPANHSQDGKPSAKRTIVHVRDLRDICNKRLGQSIIRQLVVAAQKRRRAGEEIVIVGTSASEPLGFTAMPQGLEDFRAVRLPAVFDMSKEDQALFKPGTSSSVSPPLSPGSPYSRILEMNLRHIQAMLANLRPDTSIDLFSEAAQGQLAVGGDELGKAVLSFDKAQRLVLTAIGLAESHAASPSVTASHIGLAALVDQKAADVTSDWATFRNNQRLEKLELDIKEGTETDAVSDKGQSRLEKMKKDCNPHEIRHFPGVVDAQNIKTGFDQVHAPQETIDALKTLTSLSLLRPDAFKYGVLAADRLPGLLLYGPPGTGKTLLAKAVAKESGATVLEVSGAAVYEKYVGEGEKMVRAVFSLAKKLSPCIVFIDEADAIFGSRSNAGNRNTHREIINQFLREWDGMDLHNVFIMVASNRPFDLDDAVLRRLPRRLLVDLPVAKDRESILKIHLTDEALDETVNLPRLAEDTALYSGSDLKNLCVSAALACVREENELVDSKKDDKDFKLPEKRILSNRHFEKAIKEISASISEDMSSLTAIRKFDEQYGDRRGRRKKASYGFGVGDVSVDENAARVRHSETSAPP